MREEHPSSIAAAQDAAFDAFLQRARAAKQNSEPIFNHPTLDPQQRARRMAITGAVIGVLASLTFALVAQSVNLVLLPGLPLYQSVFEPLFNILLITAFGALLCLVSVASLKIQNWVIAGLLVGLGLLIVYTYYQTYGSIVAGIMEGLGFSFLFIIPILLVILGFVPFGMLMRWAARPQVRYFYRPWFYWKRLLPVLVLLAAAVYSGTLFVYSAPEQKAIRTMDGTLRAALASHSEAQLPNPIKHIGGTPFFPYAKGAYHLVAQHNPIPTRVLSDGTPYKQDIFVSAQFQRGYWLTCRFTSTGSLIDCFSWYTPPYSDVNG